MKSRAVGSLTHPGDSEWNSEPMDLVELLKRPEGKTLEFKRDLSTPSPRAPSRRRSPSCTSTRSMGPRSARARRTRSAATSGRSERSDNRYDEVEEGRLSREQPRFPVPAFLTIRPFDFSTN